MSDSLDDILAEASSLSLTPDAGELRAAASPFAFAPARVMGVREEASNDEGTISSKRYSVVSVRGSDLSLCFGVVGVGGVSFCIRKKCRVKAHEDSKVWLCGRDEAVMFISRVQDAVVYSDPYVEESLVAKETQDDWKGRTMTLPGWVKAFRAVTISENEDDRKVTVDDVKVKTKFLSDAEKFRTPAKKKSRNDLYADDNKESRRLLEEISVELLDRALPSVDDSDALDAVIIDGSMLKGGLTRIVARVEANVITLGESLKQVGRLTSERLEENEKNVNLLSGVVQILHATLGSTVGLDLQFEAPTLWGTTALVADEVTRLGQMVVRMESDMHPMRAAIDEMRVHQERLVSDSKNGPEANDKMRKVLVLVMGHVKKVTPELDRIKVMIQHLGAEIAEVRDAKRLHQTEVQGSREETGDPMDELMDMMTSNASVDEVSSSLSRKIGSPGQFEEFPERDVGITSAGSKRSNVKGEIVRERELLRRLETEVSMLVNDVGLLKACADDTAVKFGGLGLRNLQECHEWIGENFKTLRYGLIMDPLLMLDRIFGADDAEAESQFKILESRVKLRITTGAEAAAIKALHFSRPRLFHKGRVAMVNERNASKLSKLPNFKSWKSAGEGVRNYVTKQMNLIHSTISHDIGYAFGGDPQLVRAQVLATASLNATITFLSQLMGFIDTIYEKLLVESRFTGEQAWSLTTQILDRICEDLYAPKEGVAAAMTVEDPVSMCSHLIWSCLKTHDVMSGYIEHQFENHPAISAEYVKFLATNSGSEKVERMDGVVSSLTEKLNRSMEETKKAVSKADVATAKLSDLLKEVQVLAKKVKQLEDKAGR
jgi:hypothetical protein